MPEEERHVMRFQKQRMKEATADRFALRDEDGDNGIALTHLGRSLAEFDDDMPGVMPCEAPTAVAMRCMASAHLTTTAQELFQESSQLTALCSGVLLPLLQR